MRYPPRVWYEDIRTTLKLFLAAKTAVFLDDIGYNYLLREGSITKNLNADRNVEILEAFDDILSYFKAQGMFQDYREELCYLTLYHATSPPRCGCCALTGNIRCSPGLRNIWSTSSLTGERTGIWTGWEGTESCCSFLLQRKWVFPHRPAVPAQGGNLGAVRKGESDEFDKEVERAGKKAALSKMR